MSPINVLYLCLISQLSYLSIASDQNSNSWCTRTSFKTNLSYTCNWYFFNFSNLYVSYLNFIWTLHWEKKRDNLENWLFWSTSLFLYSLFDLWKLTVGRVWPLVTTPLKVMNQNKLQTDRPHLRNFPHTSTNYRQTWDWSTTTDIETHISDWRLIWNPTDNIWQYQSRIHFIAPSIWFQNH